MHTCSGFIIGCMDFRIQKALNVLITDLKIEMGDVDRVTVAGGAGNTGLMFYHIDLSSKLHGPHTFILTAHEDCGYGTTKDDLLKSQSRMRKELSIDQVVRAFWIYRPNFQDNSQWTYEEVWG